MDLIQNTKRPMKNPTTMSVSDVPEEDVPPGFTVRKINGYLGFRDPMDNFVDYFNMRYIGRFVKKDGKEVFVRGAAPVFKPIGKKEEEPKSELKKMKLDGKSYLYHPIYKNVYTPDNVYVGKLVKEGKKYRIDLSEEERHYGTDEED